MSTKPQPVKVTITSATILKIFGVMLVLLFVYAIRDIIILLVISMVLSAALDPWVTRLQKQGLHRSLSIVLLYVLILSIASVVVVAMIPPIIEQIAGLYQRFPIIVQQFSAAVNSIQGFTFNSSIQDSLNTAFQQFETTATVSKLISAIGNFFGGLFGVVALFVITFYMVIKEDNIEKLVHLVSPVKYHEFLSTMLKSISEKLGVWLRSQLLIGLIVGILVFIGLKIIGVEYALILAVLAAITELIPFIGPWIAAIPGVLVAFTQAPVLGVVAAVVYLLVQQLENHFITPRIMSKAVGMSPLMVIVALLIGAKLAGVFGSLLAVPIALIISELIKHLDKIPE